MQISQDLIWNEMNLKISLSNSLKHVLTYKLNGWHGK
jgi:hypothetical protein